jgi:ADP-heptose:LPS heptosyltransferase
VEKRMNVNVMRWIDHYAGVPITFFLTVCLKIRRLILPVKKEFPAEVKNILFIELSEMGSLVLLSPLVDRTRKAYPNANVYFMSFKNISPALHVLQMIDRDKVLTLRSENLPVFLMDLARNMRTIMRIPFDITFDLELFSRISSILSFFSGARVKVGFDNFMAEGLYRGKFLTHPVTYNPHRHITQNYLAMFYALLEKEGDIPHSKRAVGEEEMVIPAIPFEAGGVEKLRSRLYGAFPALKDVKKLVALNPNSSQVMPLRRWPAEHFFELSRRLLKIPDLGVVITGGPGEMDDAAVAAEICRRAANPRVVNLAGFTTMEELIMLYRIVDVLVSNDSGPAHFAAVARTKTVILFGPESPALYGSLNPNAHNFYKHLQCSPCSTAYNQRTSPCRNNVCMQSITVDEVYGKVVEMLGAAAVQ